MGFAAIMIKQHTGRTVHLADDNTLGAVDDKGAVVRHQRHVAHIDVLLLDIEHGAGFGFAIDFKYDQAQRNAHWRGVSNSALAAFLSVKFRIFENIVDEIKLSGAREIADREHTAQRLFKARNIANRMIRPEELFIRFALNLNQVRHLRHFVNVSEHLADTLCSARAGLGNRHYYVSPS